MGRDADFTAAGSARNIGTQVGKKKTQDVQFYTEVMEVNQAIDAGRRSMYDPDELEEEQRERETRNRVSSDDISPEVLMLVKLDSLVAPSAVVSLKLRRVQA